jgi:hypothetical protein
MIEISYQSGKWMEMYIIVLLLDIVLMEQLVSLQNFFLIPKTKWVKQGLDEEMQQIDVKMQQITDSI